MAPSRPMKKFPLLLAARTICTLSALAFLVVPRFLALAQQTPGVPLPLPLWNGKDPVGDGTFQDEMPQITVHRPEKPNGTAMIICPGGGYGGLMMQPEGHGIAQWLNEHGITGVVLKYRLPRGNSMVPLLD